MASSSTPSHDQIRPKNAFEQLAPCFSVSASTGPWQIFINHRGSDTKYTFANKIQEKLDGVGFRAFLDVEALQPGDLIPAEIQAAMTSASLHIAILSPDYAESPWCLAELAFMLQTPAKIFPVFYHVESSDVRWVQKGIYAHAFSEYGKKGRYTQEKLDEWKTALHNISFRSGYPVNNNEDEATECPRYLENEVEVDETSGHLCKGDYLFYLEGKEKNEEERKVVLICVCLHKSRPISVWSLFFRGSVEVEREKAVVVEGRRERVVEAFYRLLARLE
ncbi:hypothetical protein SUGI_0683760 [Cryptomeria japonica]|uniref:probable 2' cyclic ADP-D-ribose synthase BdTIR n=1 Tax=Cryptomeria japonica TaxID=3369 RepID=UPI002414BE80|nr:probable 2' cyclic ADP-D-ribose synthase BdTIR [Cryptomeria japonica]GLJ33997.1 hypothetical protein SUGI_0683760 [Cryptomeria japonica]